ncbi:MAG: UDP-N-acetylglucosamine 2-epimerase (non-hydrolyzing) [Elusimicrobiota bacterium]
MKITIVAGARPNFMKIAPIIHEMHAARGRGDRISYRLVHTGQHYDAKMNSTFFNELDIPPPDVNLGVGSGSQAEQTARIMVRFEQEVSTKKPDLVLVVGDVTSAMACAITAKKLHIKVAHVEGGIRSFDTRMPEEINRIVTDSITDYFFTTSKFANENLRKMGVERKRILFVGNTMIDTLLRNLHRLEKPAIFDKLGLSNRGFFVLTLHRPSNVDDAPHLRSVILSIVNGVRGLPIVFPMHPRTARVYSHLGLRPTNLHAIEPLGYLGFNYLVKRAKAVITDSGGITEETTVLGVPCMTLRENTERPETCTVGTNVLLGSDPRRISRAMRLLFAGKWAKGKIPHLWDGRTSRRIVQHLLRLEHDRG